MAFTTVVTHATGDVFPATDWNTYVRDNINFLTTQDGLVPLWDSTDAGVVFPAASVTTPTLPQTFKNLLIVARGRVDAALTFADLAVRFNGDAAGNYDYEKLETTGATGTIGREALAAISGTIGEIVGASAPASMAGSVEVVVPYYTTTNLNKTWIGRSATKIGTSTGNMLVSNVGGHWRSNAAITTLTFFSSGGGNLISGTEITVYGAA